MHSSSRRKYDSGALKCKKEQKLEDAQSQRGALDKFVVEEPQTNSANQNLDANIDDGDDDNVVEVELSLQKFMKVIMVMVIMYMRLRLPLQKLTKVVMAILLMKIMTLIR